MQLLYFILCSVSLLLCSCASNGVTYYVTPNSTTPCPSEPCHVLSYYAQHNTFNTSNARFVFLPGNHTLNTTIVVENVQNLTLTGDDRFETGLLGLPVPSSQIHCNRINGTGFDFENLSNLVIKNLLFLKCANLKYHDYYWVAHCAIRMVDILNSTISRVTIQQSPGCGIEAVNVCGSITESIFLSSNDTQVYIVYDDVYYYTYNYSHCGSPTFLIKSSQFLYGYSQSQNLWSVGQAGGLSFYISKTDKYPSVTIVIDNITAVGNTGYNGGHLSLTYDAITTTGPSITVINSYFMDGHSDIYSGGGALNALLVLQSTPTYIPLTITNCTFQSNTAIFGGAVLITMQNTEDITPDLPTVLFQNCAFLNNTSQLQDAGTLAMSSAIGITFKHCTFSSSALTNSYSVTYLVNSNITFSNCTFEDNIGTAIAAVYSIIVFEGNNTFRNNTSMYGGALLFYTNSYMILQENTRIHFINNHADYVGGAIFVQCVTVSPCFFQVPTTNATLLLNLNIRLHFENNTAEHGGTPLFGGLVVKCEMIVGKDDLLDAWKYFQIITGLHNTVSEPSTISSDPIGVCFCTNNIPMCDKKWNTITIYPGQSFKISAIAIGQTSGTIGGVIHADVDGGTIGHLQGSQTQQSYENCTNFSYTAFTYTNTATLTLTISESEGGITCKNIPQLSSPNAPPTPPPKVYIVLQDCPAGFSLTNNSTQPKCDCAPILKKHHISCDINKGTIHRPASSWIGYHNASHDNETSGVLYYAHCPFDYCKDTDVDIQLNNSDEQCAFGHSGILCGSCKPGLSLALGTSQCLKCSNTYLTLLIAFGVAGFALVLLLVICNLTVTEGTLNGLIFYANIIWVKKAIFFPSNNSNILTVFIAWANLDLGIQTCFYDGMDAYGKTWLQFAFPLYIWTLVGLIIYLSRYRVVNRLIGQNAVKVLATLFLLSYAKLQRTIIAALSVTFIQYPDNSKRYVWLHDGNVGYFTGKQIPLLMAGLASLLFMSLPYTLALFLICYIRRIATPRYRLLRWIVRLLPLFDAYTAPYKPRYQFWTGFLLFVRNILFLVFAFNYSNDPALNLMAVAIASLFVFTLAWSLGGIYKNQPLNIPESSFILNLGTVSVIVLYTGASQSTSVVTYTSTGIAFATFIGIMLYHCSKQVSKTGLWRGLRAAARSHLGVGRRARGDEAEPLLAETNSPEQREREIHHRVYYDPRHCRESLLEQLTDPSGNDQ